MRLTELSEVMSYVVTLSSCYYQNFTTRRNNDDDKFLMSRNKMYHLLTSSIY